MSTKFNYKKYILSSVLLAGMFFLVTGIASSCGASLAKDGYMKENLNHVSCPKDPDNYIMFIDSCPSELANFSSYYHYSIICNTDERYKGHSTKVLKTYFASGGSKKIWLVTAGKSGRFVTAVRLALKCNIKIISTSTSGPAESYSQLEQNIITKFVKNGGRYYAAAGNDSLDIDIDPQYPAAYDGVIAVGAMACLQSADYSNFGNKVVYDCGEAYDLESVGTSYATPRYVGKKEH